VPAVAMGSRSACRKYAVSALQHGNAGADLHSSAGRRDLEISISAMLSDHQSAEGSFF